MMLVVAGLANSAIAEEIEAHDVSAWDAWSQLAGVLGD